MTDPDEKYKDGWKRRLSAKEVEHILESVRSLQPVGDPPPLPIELKSESLKTCPQCGGMHFNATIRELICASVTEKTNYKVVQGGCGWRGQLL